MRLDLHNTKHEEVLRKVDLFIWENMQMNTQQVEIITGKSIPMKSIVNDVLREYGLTSREGFTNSGTLIVDLI